MRRWNGAPPTDVELVPVTAAELRRRMDRLLCRVAPRVLTDPRLPTGKTCFARLDTRMLVRELKHWTSGN